MRLTCMLRHCISAQLGVVASFAPVFGFKNHRSSFQDAAKNININSIISLMCYSDDVTKKVIAPIKRLL